MKKREVEFALELLRETTDSILAKARLRSERLARLEGRIALIVETLRDVLFVLEKEFGYKVKPDSSFAGTDVPRFMSIPKKESPEE